MNAERIAEIKARADAATDATGLVYDMRADEWLVSTDKSTALALMHAVRDLRDLLAEVERLTRWKREALPVFEGLESLGRALDIPLGKRITGAEALAAVERLTVGRDALAAKVDRVRDLHRESHGAMSALYPMPICECGKDYPCPTVRALGGEVR